MQSHPLRRMRFGQYQASSAANDISDVSLSPGAKLFLFADDILLFKPFKSESGFCDFQKDIDAISNWTVANHLTLNANKTKFMLISRIRELQCQSFLLNGIQIERVRHFKYLGIWLSDDLTWSKHIESVCCKAQRLLGYIYRAFSPHCFPESILPLYKTQVLPILEYGCVIWDPHLKKDKKLLESVQYFAIQITTKTWSSHNTSLPHELPSLESRRQYHKLLYTFKFLNGLSFCPPGFFTIKSNPNLRIYHSKCLLQPLAKTVSFSNFFLLVQLSSGTPYLMK